MKDLISVIVPVYNVEKYLNRCVDSILNQTYTNLEVILVDDGGPDNCPAICDAYAKQDKRVKVIHKANGGVSDARNAGLDVAKGDFIAFVDSDDWIDCTMYEKLLNKQKENNADLVFCKYNYVDAKTIKHVNEFNLMNLSADNIFPLFYQDMIKTNGNYYIHTHNVMGSIFRVLFSKKIINNLKFDTKVKIEEDVLFLSNLLLNNAKCDYVDEYLYNYFFRDVSAVNIPNKEKLEIACVFSKEIEKLKLSDELIASIKFNEFSFYYLWCIKSNIKLTNKELFSWNTHYNYKCHFKNEFGIKTKIKFLLIRMRMSWILKLLYRLK